jgi:hypothetical protein
LNLHLPSTTSDRPYSPEVFRITHPFHPLYDQAFELVQVRSNWGKNHVYYVHAEDELKILPISWTSLAAPDPFVTMAAGRAAFRLADLLSLVHLIQDLTL